MEYDFRGRSGSGSYGAPPAATAGAGSSLYPRIGQPSHGAATAPPRAAPYHHASASAAPSSSSSSSTSKSNVEEDLPTPQQEDPEPLQEDPKEAADFSFKDGKKLWSLVRQELALINKKRRWLASMIPGPDGCISPVKRPKFLKDVHLTESDVRSDEVSSERVKVSVERSFGSQCNWYNHHIVQDGMQLFNLQKGKDGSLCPGSSKIVHRTISKLSNEALQSVANIATSNRISFEKIRPRMKKIIKDHLPKYLAELDNENAKSQLSEILTNSCNYQSNYVSLVTTVSPILLSSINQALDGLNEMPEQALVAMNRKLREKSCPPRFLHVAQASTRSHVVSMINKRCRKIISELEEGNYLPKKLAKALSVMNLYWKLTLKCMNISQSEFFPFSRGTMSLQNDVLNALWSLPKVNHNDLKLLRPILGQGSKVEKMFFKVALKRYLIDCLFECDEGNLPDEALRTIAFLIRMSPKRQQVILTEERKEEEVEAVLDLSSRLKSLGHCGTEGCPSDDEVSLGSDKCSEDNDSVLTETNYFNFGSQQQKMDEGCCSNIMTNTADMSVGGKNYVPEAEDSVSQLEEVLGRPCGRIEEIGGVGHYRDSEAAGSMMEPHLTKVVGANNMKVTRCSEDLSVICDETASMAHKLVGQILKNMLLAENNEVDVLTGGYLGGGSISQGPQALVTEENQEADIVIQAVQGLLPNLSESCIGEVRRILLGGEQ